MPNPDAEHIKTIRPSLLLNGYLFFSLLFDVARCRTFWIGQTETAIVGLFTATVAIKVVVLVLEAIEKRDILDPRFQDAPPEAIAGIYNRSVFWWLNLLFRRGFRKNLGLDDLYPLDKHLASTYLQYLLGSAWTKGALILPKLCAKLTLNSRKPVSTQLILFDYTHIEMAAVVGCHPSPRFDRLQLQPAILTQPCNRLIPTTSQQKLQ